MKKYRKMLFACFLASAVLAVSGRAAMALEVSDGTEKVSTDTVCSITVDYGQYVQEGVDACLYKVADMDAADQFILLSPFSGYDLSLNGITGDSQWKNALEETEQILRTAETTPCAKESTDSKGRIVFTDLDTGLYLLESTDRHAVGERYVFSGALIIVPGTDDDGNLIRDVVCFPKGSKITPTPVPTTTISRDVPSTGDGNRMESWIGLMTASLAAVFLSLIVRKKKQR